MHLVNVAIHVSHNLINEVCIIVFQIDNQALIEDINIK